MHSRKKIIVQYTKRNTQSDTEAKKSIVGNCQRNTIYFAGVNLT